MHRLKQVAILFLAISIGFSSATYGAPSQEERDSLVTIKIVNGTTKAISYSPWQVALIDTSKSSNFQGQFCGGSLISREWIVTAAHCLDDVATTVDSFKVLAGTSTLSTTKLSGNSVNSFFVHPSWNPSTKENDIALVQLKVPLVLSLGTIEVIELPNTKAASGTTARITGWGSLLKRAPTANSASDYLFPAELVGAEIFVNSDSDCSTEFNTFSNFYFADSMLCANDMETDPAAYIDTCQADSGGPLAIEESGTWYLSGITSWGVGCAQGYSGVYTNVYNYNSWISSNSIENRFRVAFNSKGGSSVSASSFASGGSVSTPSSPSRSGYTFAGWSLTDGGAKLTFPYTPLATADFTLFAKWIKKASASTKPTLTGTAKVNRTVSAKKGTWSGIPTPAITYQWYACSKAVTSARTTIPSSCKSISGATKSTLKLKKAQKGKYLAVRVTGKSSGTSSTSWLTKSTKKVK